MQVVQQPAAVQAAPPAADMYSTRAGEHSIAGMCESENQTCQQQQQHVTDQLGNLSMHHGQSACLHAYVIMVVFCGECIAIPSRCCYSLTKPCKAVSVRCSVAHL